MNDHSQKTFDPVSSPEHYIKGRRFQPIHVIQSWGLERNYYVANSIKYIARAGHKGPEETDIRKALWYLTYGAFEDTHQQDIKVNDVIEDWKLSPYLACALTLLAELAAIKRPIKEYYSLVYLCLRMRLNQITDDRPKPLDPQPTNENQ